MGSAGQNRVKRGGGSHGGRRRPEVKHRREPKVKLRARERAEIARLEERLLVEIPKPGEQWIPPVAEALTSSDGPCGTNATVEGSVSASAARKELTQSLASGACSNADGVGPFGKSVLTQLLFEDLPLSQPTLKGLSLCRFRRLTAVQAAVIPHALVGRDVKAQARTGSGKTLAFVVPVSMQNVPSRGAVSVTVIGPFKNPLISTRFAFSTLRKRATDGLGVNPFLHAPLLSTSQILERLFREQICNVDGLAALAIAPTRELAVQIFDVFREVGRHHEFSLGCLMGGKDLRAEAERVQSLNIVVGTPGRLLQHVDESPMWDSSRLLVLAVDEADRLVDMGFFDSLRLIVDSLPASRQTLLFSATLKSAVSRLGVFLCKDEAETVDGGDSAGLQDSSALKQSFLVVQQKYKTSALFSILRAQCRKKVIVFVSSCKQAKFLCDAFKALKPGKLLIAQYTDLAARGVDFICEQKPKKGSTEPRVSAVDLVVQFDCPDSVETHIHRVGRTARLQRKGQAVLLLLPSEAEFANQLMKRGVGKIDLKQITLNPKKAIRVDAKLQALLASNSELKNLAQRAVAAYLRCVAVMPDKTVFNLKAIDLQQLALCYGLQIAPSLEEFENSEQRAEPVSKGESVRKCAAADETDEKDIRLCGGAVTNTTQKKRKNRSKLERLKEQIRMKALEKKRRREMAATEAEPSGEFETQDSLVETKTETEESLFGGLSSMQDGKGEALAQSDELLVRVGEGSALEETTAEKRQRITEALLQKPAYKRERLRFRADGSAKMKGLAVASENSHIFFEDEAAADGAADSRVTSSLQATEHEELVTEAGRASAPELKKAFVEEMRKKVAAVRNEDKVRDQLRIHEKHTKRRRKERRARQLAEGGGHPVAVLEGAESEDNTSAEASAEEGDYARGNGASAICAYSEAFGESACESDANSYDGNDPSTTREYVAQLEALALKAAAQ